MNEKNETGMGELIQIDEARIRDHLEHFHADRTYPAFSM